MDIKLAVPGIIGLVVFIIIFNVYHIIKIRKKNSRRLDAVNMFKANYKKGVKEKSKEKTDDYTKYITKYNSSVDFIDKDTFVKEAMEQGKNQAENMRRTNPKNNGLHKNIM